jgi:hypothetical protein
MWQCFGVLRDKHQKEGFNRRTSANTVGGGAGSHPTPNHVIRSGWSTRHLPWVIRPTRHTARNLQHLSHDCSTLNIPIHYYFWQGKTNIARIDSQQYNRAESSTILSYVVLLTWEHFSSFLHNIATALSFTNIYLNKQKDKQKVSLPPPETT